METFTTKKKRFFTVKKVTIGSVVLLLIILTGIVGAYFVSKHNRQLADERLAAQAEAENNRISADPINVNRLYIVLNMERAKVGARALSTVDNLTSAAQQKCDDMVSGSYFALKNPVTGKTANSYVDDNTGSLYFKSVSSILMQGSTTTMTASQVIQNAIKEQAANLYDPKFNSVGWATCDTSGTSQLAFVVGMLADMEDKPVSKTYAPTYVPTYTPPVKCYTSYNPGYDNIINPSSTTQCN